ncbi:GIY-YIG nuclease family protein [Galbibacter mesophilus]|uniref:GIY-YIG nuclease family protein n=1 Tax=Galbibacter mesophilus TaxID=379069 RepID=UPI00191D775B|nr:GIY-YIG nuclease family protein [Galbibacter mesophilus]MCM5663601.1 GIY-YIG nuclease family protein [Galbibacter mesophilus]
MYFVYILYSEKLDKYYKGFTRDMNDRLYRHNSGLENFTSKGAPWKLMLTIEKATKKEALSLERKLKNLNRSRLESFIVKYSSNQDD